MRRFLLCTLTACAFGGSAVAVTPARAQHDHQDAGEHEDVVRLTPGQIDEFGIELAEAGPVDVVITVDVPGEVRTNADRLAHIVPRYAGIVTAVKADIGDRVAKGQVLAEVESDESLAPFEVGTLISGTVIEKHITLGEAVGREGPAFVIADLSTVWIDLTVYQRDVERIGVGQAVDVLVGHEPWARGTIRYVTPIVDEHTRTATARLELPNPDGRWRPGMFVTGRVIVDASTAAVGVPRTALHTFEERTVVFVESDAGFVPRPVTVGRLDAAHAEVLDGLASGERYVAAGGFTIKAELGKGSFGSGHAH